ncbi:apoptotic chromatin condensation inducer in the nucleus [Spea bombifrons]|uniref:apoptotic chromatin condensation inducer in the nucleus n=1 Tax=Spea bombifrons TaxID=233779 RepID=UPI0023490C36|nr:apoptotic chromatin condensation inducer in the nucleus [Spea bombifrons]
MAELEDVTLDGRPLDSLRVTDLRAALEERGLAKSGQKSALMKRLKGALMLENLQKHSTPHTGFQPNSQMGEEMGQNSFIKQYLEKQQELLRQRLQREAREAAETEEHTAESEDEAMHTEIVPEPPDLFRSVLKMPEVPVEKRTPKKCRPVLEDPEDSEEEVPRKRERRSSRVKQAKTLKPPVFVEPAQEQEQRRTSTRARRSKGDTPAAKEELEGVGAEEEEEEEIEEDKEIKVARGEEEVPKRRRSTRATTPQQHKKSPVVRRSPSPPELTETEAKSIALGVEVTEDRVPPMLSLEGVKHQISAETQISPVSEKAGSVKLLQTEGSHCHRSPQKMGRQAREKTEGASEQVARRHPESSIIRQTPSWHKEPENTKAMLQGSTNETDGITMNIIEGATSKDIKARSPLVLMRPPVRTQPEVITSAGEQSLHIVEKSSGRGVLAMSISEKQDPESQTTNEKDTLPLQAVSPAVEHSKQLHLSLLQKPDMDKVDVSSPVAIQDLSETEVPQVISPVSSTGLTRMRKLKIRTSIGTNDQPESSTATQSASLHSQQEKPTLDNTNKSPEILVQSSIHRLSKLHKPKITPYEETQAPPHREAEVTSPMMAPDLSSFKHISTDCTAPDSKKRTEKTDFGVSNLAVKETPEGRTESSIQISPDYKIKEDTHTLHQSKEEQPSVITVGNTEDTSMETTFEPEAKSNIPEIPALVICENVSTVEDNAHVFKPAQAVTDRIPEAVALPVDMTIVKTLTSESTPVAQVPLMLDEKVDVPDLRQDASQDGESITASESLGIPLNFQDEPTEASSVARNVVPVVLINEQCITPIFPEVSHKTEMFDQGTDQPMPEKDRMCDIVHVPQETSIIKQIAPELETQKDRNSSLSETPDSAVINSAPAIIETAVLIASNAITEDVVEDVPVQLHGVIEGPMDVDKTTDMDISEDVCTDITKNAVHTEKSEEKSADTDNRDEEKHSQMLVSEVVPDIHEPAELIPSATQDALQLDKGKDDRVSDALEHSGVRDWEHSTGAKELAERAESEEGTIFASELEKMEHGSSDGQEDFEMLASKITTDVPVISEVPDDTSSTANDLSSVDHQTVTPVTAHASSELEEAEGGSADENTHSKLTTGIQEPSEHEAEKTPLSVQETSNLNKRETSEQVIAEQISSSAVLETDKVVVSGDHNETIEPEGCRAVASPGPILQETPKNVSLFLPQEVRHDESVMLPVHAYDEENSNIADSTTIMEEQTPSMDITSEQTPVTECLSDTSTTLECVPGELEGKTTVAPDYAQSEVVLDHRRSEGSFSPTHPTTKITRSGEEQQDFSVVEVAEPVEEGEPELTFRESSRRRRSSSSSSSTSTSSSSRSSHSSTDTSSRSRQRSRSKSSSPEKTKLRSRSSSSSSSKSSSSSHSDKAISGCPTQMQPDDFQSPMSMASSLPEASQVLPSPSPPHPSTQVQREALSRWDSPLLPVYGERRQLHDPSEQVQTKKMRLEEPEEQDQKCPVSGGEQEVEEVQSPGEHIVAPETEDSVMEASDNQTEGELQEPASSQPLEESCDVDDKKESTTTPRTFKRKISVLSATKSSSQPPAASSANSDSEGAHPARRRRWGASTATTQKKPSISISTESLKSLMPEIKEIKQEAVVDLHAEDTHISEDEVERNGDDGSHDKGLKICRTVTQVVPAEVQENGQEPEDREPEEAAITEPESVPMETEVVAPIIEQEVKKPLPESPSQAEVRVTLGDTLLRRSISQQKTGVSITIDDPVRTACQLPSPPRHKISCIVHICNLVRPFTLGQLKELLSRTGTLVEESFWIDKIKSHCYATYSTVEEAVATRNSLHGVKWPQSNPKFLSVDFAEQDELDFHRGLLPERPQDPKPEEPPHSHPHPHIPTPRGEHKEHERGVREQWAEREREMERRERTRSEREWDRDKVREGPRSRSRDRRRKEHAKSKEKKNEKKEKVQEEPPAKLLDDLFHKTKAAPCIYWLPLTEEQVLKKVADRAERAKEREKRRKEQEEQEEEERKERAKEREKEAERNRDRAREAEREKRREHSRERPRERERRDPKRHSRSRSRSTPVRDRGGRR